MAGLTLAQAQANLDAANAAYAKALEAESYSHSNQTGSRSVTRNPATLLAQIKHWETRVNKLSAGSGGPRVRGATPT